MRLSHIAIVFLLMIAGRASAGAQDQDRVPPSDSTASPAAEPEPIRPPKRGTLLDVFKAIAPPLIDAATQRPPPPVIEPAPVPVAEPRPRPAPEAVLGPVAAPVRPVTRPPPRVAPAAVIAPATPRPVPPRPKPAPIEVTPAAAIPAPSLKIPEAPTPLPPIPAPPATAAIPAPLPVADPVPPPAATATDAAATSARTDWWLLVLATAAVAVAAAAAHQLRRMRQIAHTRAVLALDPRLDSALGTCSTSGLALTGPRFSMHARLLPAAHG